MIGDIICSIPFFSLLEKFYPDSQKTLYIDPKCRAIEPLLKGHRLINDIYISDKNDEFTELDRNFIEEQGFGVVFNPYTINLHQWYNTFDIRYANLATMEAILPKITGITKESLDLLNSEEWKPRLNQWFPVKRKTKKSIALLPFSGYHSDSTIDKRSPSVEWWGKLIPLLEKMGFDLYQFGHPKSTRLDFPNVIDRRDLSLFDMIKEILGCSMVIGTDSGSMHILGAYGFPQITLYTNYMENHYQNFTAFLPANCDNNDIPIFGEGGINNISHKEVVESIANLYFLNE